MILWQPIPGETPIDDVSKHNIKGNRSRADLNAAEARNLLEAAIKYLAAKPSRHRAPFTMRWVKQLHREIFGHVWSWAGSFRSTQTKFGVPVSQIERDLDNLLRDLEQWSSSGMPWLEQAGRLHHRAVAIEPFVNGNGHWARMLTNIWLKQHDQPITQWPSDLNDQTENRQQYLQAIRQADGHDLESLIAMHQRYSLKSPVQ